MSNISLKSSQILRAHMTYFRRPTTCIRSLQFRPLAMVNREITSSLII